MRYVQHYHNPPLRSLRLDQIIRLILSKVFRSPNNAFIETVPESWEKSFSNWHDDVQKSFVKYNANKVFPWPVNIAPCQKDIKKLESMVYELPPSTRDIVNAFLDAQVFFATKYICGIQPNDRNWLNNLKNKTVYKQIFFDDSGRNLLENIMLSKYLSELLENRPDRVEVLKELYVGNLRSVKIGNKTELDTCYPLISLPDAITSILPLSPEANKHLLEYLIYRRPFYEQFIHCDSFHNAAKIANHPNSIFCKKDKTISTFEEMDLASSINVPGYLVIEKIAQGSYKQVWKIKEEKSPINRVLVYKHLSSLNHQDEKPVSSHDIENLRKAGGLNNLLKNELEQIEKLRLKGFPIPQLHQILPNGWIEDYIEGENLKQKYDRLRQKYGALSSEVFNSACEDFRSIFYTLQKIHKEGVLHRDVKLENFIQEKNTGQIYVTDFGLSLKGVFGARIYAAPEVLRSNGEEYTEQSEGWSFAVALYHAITGEYPFGSDKTETMNIFKDEKLTEKYRQQALSKFSQKYEKIIGLLYDHWHYEPTWRMITADFITVFLNIEPSDNERENVRGLSIQITNLLENMKTQIDTKAPNDIKSAYQRVVQDIRKILEWGHP